MNYYGLTGEEKKTHLQQYNHALFRNASSFIDISWEINLLYGTVVVLEDRSEPDPARKGKEFDYATYLHSYLAERAFAEDTNLFLSHLALTQLEQLQDEVSFHAHLRTADGVMRLHRIVLTPARDAHGLLVCVYLGAQCIQADVRTPDTVPLIPPQFRDALLSNCYFHFDVDVTDGGLIWGDYEAKDGTHPIRDATGISGPLNYSLWVDKWYELYKPEFEKQPETNIFNIEYFKRCYAANERFLDVEVKQLSPVTGKTEYMHIFVALMENPADQHIHACIIWREIDSFRGGMIEDRLNMLSDNEALKRTVSRDDQFLRAALSGAMMVYNINLTQNLIEEEFYEIVDGTSYPMLQLVNLRAPCSFDEFCTRWCEVKVARDSQSTFMELYNRRHLLDCFEKGEYQLEIEFETVIGRGIPVMLRNTVLLVKDPESGDILAMVNAKDVTAQRQEELEKRQALQAAFDAANRANAAKTDFLARMSHDIRTPMNGIVGMTAIAATHLDDKARVADCLSKISVSSKHLLRLLNEVLDMSKIESGKIDLQEEAFSLSDLIEELLSMCRSQIKAKHHELNVSIRNIEHERVIGDSQHLQQAFMNLLGNAIKYTPPGGRISLTCTEKATNHKDVGCYEFIFEDSGIGMSEEFLGRLFQPFERANDPRASKEQGTGLGMPITNNIIQMMNGTIVVESELNKGSKFIVTIFLKLQEDSAAEDLEQLLDLPVLVADDDATACEVTCAILSELGMRGEWVMSGADALERVLARHKAEDDFFAVILDWQMPGMDGVTTAREIRRQVGDTIPIVILSAYDWSDIEEEARAAGVNAFIGKPLFKSRMLYLFRELLGHPDPAPVSPMEALEQSDFSGRKALLVEDNDLNAEIATEILGVLGLQVDRAENGKIALDVMSTVEDGAYDVIFMDIQMPVMNGYESAQGIRALGRAYTGSVPILAMSANAFAEDVAAAKAAGMNGHIAKPLDLDLLVKALNRWLK